MDATRNGRISKLGARGTTPAARASAGLVALALSSAAGSAGGFRVSIPFVFLLAGTTLPPGTYTLRPSETHKRYHLADEAGMLVAGSPIRHEPMAGGGRLVFDLDHGRHEVRAVYGA